jgi:hypothetical protein
MSRPARPSASLPEGPISAFDIACTSYLYESMTDYGSSLDRLRNVIGLESALDLTKEDHQRALLTFLNAWGCRSLAKDTHARAADVLERWFSDARECLSSFDGSLSALDARSRRDLARVFDGLSRSIAAKRIKKGHRESVSFGPTAASKTLFVLRPSLFPAWDRAIRDTCGYGGNGKSYARFVGSVHGKMDELKRDCELRGPDLDDLPRVLRRPSYTTLAQLFGEYYWITLTRRVSLRDRDEISKWLSWAEP